jgi:quinoprotein glucose dehydrogenase
MSRSITPGIRSALIGLTLLVAAGPLVAQHGTRHGEWLGHGGEAGFTRYAPLDQIDAGNVGALEIVWRRAGVAEELRAEHPDIRWGSQLRSTPVMVGGALYASNGIGLVEAFDPGTGETIWVQELPPEGSDALRGVTQRTVGYWARGDEARILSVRPPYLYSLDARSGRPIPEFGDGGRVDLRHFECIARYGRRLTGCDLVESNISGPREFLTYSGPIVVGDMVIVGSSQDNHPRRQEMDPGDVRAYDARTGHLRWTFRPIPNGGELGVETWREGSWRYSGKASVWTLMSADEELGLVYLATSSPTSDMYGGHRPGDNLYANSIVAVRAATGERVWHFQTVHHDLFDYDNNAAPILTDIVVEGRPIRAVVQLTKQAMAYVFDRETGEPVWPIVERPVPGSTTPGEHPAPTQPFPTKPAPFDLQGLTIDDLIDFTPELRTEAIEIVSNYVIGPIFTPPSLVDDEPGGTRGTLQMPGATGGAEWGGAAFDPETGILYVPSITGAFVADLVPNEPGEGNVLYTRGTRALIEGPQGLPLTKPPYGRITAIDLNTGDHLWMAANGDGWRDHPAIAHLDLPPLGQPGRSMVLLTKTLLFVSEGDHSMVRTPPGGGPGAGKGFRAFDKVTGEVVWHTELPAGTVGSPITYMHEGRQYIVTPIGSTGHPGEWLALAVR